MSKAILGVDIAKMKFDVALLINGKLKHKVFTNNEEGFKLLMAWLQKQNVDHVYVCLEASSTYGDELAIYMHDAGHTVSIVNPARIKGFAQSELMRTKNDKVDAGLIARFCHAMHPGPLDTVAAGSGHQALVRGLTLTLMRTQETNVSRHPRDDYVLHTNTLRTWTRRSGSSRSRLPDISKMTRISEQKGTYSALSPGSVRSPSLPSLANSPSLRTVTGSKRSWHT